jgi:hypothetical protein
LVLLPVQPVLANDEHSIDAPAGFGGPNSVPNLLEADARIGERWQWLAVSQFANIYSVRAPESLRIPVLSLLRSAKPE